MSALLTHTLFQEYRDLLVNKTGLDFHWDRAFLLENGLRERMRVGSHTDAACYLKYLHTAPEGHDELSQLVDLITIGETYFYRNQPHFDFIQQNLVPDWKQHLDTRSITMWSAGCSTGAEPYSLAMICHAALSHEVPPWDIRIIATDINWHHLAKAKKAQYHHRAVSYLPPRYLDRYVHAHDDRYDICDEITSLVSFRYHNLKEAPLPACDFQALNLIMCRNVTIYFDPDSVKQLLLFFHSCLQPNGYLFIGHSESLWSLSNSSDLFDVIEFPEGFAYKKSHTHGSQQKRKEQDEKPPPSFKTFSDPGVYHRELARARTLADNEKYNEAIVSIKNVLQHDNLCEEAYFILGLIYAMQEDSVRAIESFDKLLYVNADLAMAYFHRARLYQQQHNHTLAQKNYVYCLSLISSYADDQHVPLSDGVPASILKQTLYRLLQDTNGDSDGHEYHRHY